MLESLTRLFIKPRDIVVVTIGSLDHNIYPTVKDLANHVKRWKALFPNHEVIVKSVIENIQIIKR